MEENIGIILGHFAGRTGKIALLDKQYGRIDGIVYANQVVVGALIHYTMHPKRAAYIIEDMNIHQVPTHVARHDILFLHHVLELCCQLIPVNSCVAGVFDLLLSLYSVHMSEVSAQYKKIFLFKLLTTLGIYNYPEKRDIMLFNRLARIPIDTIGSESLDLENEKQLDIWLRQCITEHVQISSLKTIHFLLKNRVP